MTQVLRILSTCLLFLLLLGASVTARASSAEIQCSTVHQKQRTQEEQALIESGSFVVTRGYYEYTRAFGAEFHNDLLNLKPDQTWIDMGAGRGHALRGFSDHKTERSLPLPHLVGISKQETDFNTQGKSIQWMGGKYFEDIPLTELPRTFDIVTDYYGVLSYTSKVSEYLNQVFDRMPIGGKFFVVLSKRDRIQEGSGFLSRWTNSETLIEYLLSAANVETRNITPKRGAPLGATVLVMTKTGPTKFHELEILKYRSDTPPKRVFQKSN